MSGQRALEQIDPRVRAYVTSVAVGGLGLTVLSIVETIRIDARPDFGSAILALCVLYGSMRAVRLRTGRHISLASVFCFALALTGPIALGVAAQVIGSGIHRYRQRMRPIRLLFTIGQQALALFGVRLMYAVLTNRDLWSADNRFTGRDVFAAFTCGAVYFIVGELLIAIADGLDDHDRTVWDYLVERLAPGIKSWGVSLAFTPALVAAMQISPWLIPPLLLPNLFILRSLRRDEEFTEQATRDSLTGLPNRLLLRDRITQLLADSGRDGRSFALLLLDLDHFKDINDTLGHQIGDRLLHEIGARVTAAVRDADTVARLGGDEFAVLMSSINTADDAVIVAERIQSALRSTITIDGIKLDIAASIGVVVAPMHGTDPDTLMQKVDVALYAAKEQRGCWEIYQPESDPHTVERLNLLGELRAGIESGQLVVHYQPKACAHTGEILGVEALVRWMHPTRGLLSPDVFVPLAESTGLIGELTVVVLRQALAQIRTWMSLGVDWSMAVNLSARQLSDLALPRDVGALLRDFAVPASKLTLEVTETTIMADPTRTLTVLRMLADIGVKLSIDDFGTGYSSLAYLRRLQADELKIDRTFVSSMSASSNDAVIVRSTIELGHNLGLSMVAEGVEDAATWQLLRDLGCDVIQGYHLSRPLPGDALFDWYAGYRAATARANDLPFQPEFVDQS